MAAYLFPEVPKNIRARMRRYARALRKELAAYGFYDDSYGKRYLLGPLVRVPTCSVGVTPSTALAKC